MATVQMPDGAIVELPDDADDDLKERIRQKVEAIKSRQAQQEPQPQGGSPTPTPSPAPEVAVGSEGKGLDIKPSYFQAKAGVLPEQAAANAPLGKEPLLNIPKIPQQEGAVAEIGAGAVNTLTEALSGLTSPEAIATLPLAAFPVTAPIFAEQTLETVPADIKEAFDPNKTLQERVQAGGRGLLSTIFAGLMTAGAAKISAREIPTRIATKERPPLADALAPLFGKEESPTPLADAATKEVEHANGIPSTERVDIREQGRGLGEETSLRQSREIAGAGPQAEAAPISRPETPIEAPAAVTPPETATVAPQPAAVAPEAAVAAEPVAPAPAPEAPRTYFKGDQAEYTGEVVEQHGGTFYQVKMLEGTDAGKTKYVVDPPKIEPPAPEAKAPIEEPTKPTLLPGEKQGDLLTSTQPEDLKLVGEKGVDYDALQKAEETAAADRAASEKGQTTFEDLGEKLSKEEERRLQSEYEKEMLGEVEEHQARGGDELLNAIQSVGGMRSDSPHFSDLREAFNKKAGFSKLVTGEKVKYSDVFKRDAMEDDRLVQALRAKGFDIEDAGHLADILDTRFKTGKKIYGMEARAEEGGITGLEGQAMGAAGTREIPIRGWKEMLESGERTPVETPDLAERAKGEIGKVVDTIGKAFRNVRDFVTVDPVPKLTRAGLSDAAYEHASARNSVLHQVRHILSRVFPDEYKNPAAMQRTGDILTKDNVLGVYDQAKSRLDDAEPNTPEYNAAAEQIAKIEEAHNLAAYDRDVTEAIKDPVVARHIERWKTWVNPEMDRMYNEIKSLDPWTIQEPRGRHFGARINLLPLNQAEDLARFTDTSHPMPDLVTSNYRNPNIKADPFMRRAAGTGQYSTDPGLILTNSIARRYNEVTKLRLYNAIEKSGNGFITDAGVRPDATHIGGEELTRLAIKVPETNPESGLTRPVEKSLWLKKSISREVRDVLNTDMAAPSNPVFRGLTQLQLFQLADATAHMKNIHTVVANSLGASKPWQDAVRKMPFLATADTVGRIASVVREVAADTPAIRDEISQMAKQGMIRPKYPSVGVQKVTKMQDAIHHVDTAARIVMNRFWDNLAERGMVTDTPAARRKFVQQIGEYNSRLMGHFSRTLRNYGASPFVVAGRTFNAFSKRLILGDPGFKAASPQAAALARSYQLTSLALATTVPAIINYVITGKFGGRPGTPIGAIDTGMDNEKGDKKIIDVFQLMGIRRGLRATGLGAVIEGAREGKSLNQIGGKAIEDITTTASHPWLGPGLGAIYSGISGKRLDLRGGAWPYAAKQLKEGGLRQYGENLRVTLKNQNPLLYGLVSPLVGETDDTYTEGLARGFLKAPLSAAGYVEKPGESAFEPKRERQKTGVKVKP